MYIYNVGIIKFDNENDEFIKYEKFISVFYNIDNECDVIEC